MLIRTLLLLNLSFCLTASSLKEAFKDKFRIGSAINIQEQLIQNPEKFEALIQKEFNSLVAENAMKWDAINPRKGVYDFKFADALVNFAHKNNMQVVGHVLFWHNQNPDWLFKDDQGETVSKDELLKRMRFHITTLHKRYGNKIQSWDVVNEAIIF
ncbi:Endo-1,4-beta-xylanase [Lentisphaera araneosa HTCC2155]|uniref:Endo-1,4-beta-xylanase n=1 Tax=Lentisphaera araneosa HTCC2155 TaxID=313628 RepID=A6DFM3_9BACT|nr:endo-1,4-beta-xylanase [Lentisphaera araneosa]EDM29603.1 Endo-1,4-beta-xylanase [Lentisphaera araneosa HTCC2155]